MSPEKIFILGKTIDLIGKLLIAFTAIRVHHTVLKDKKLDKHVFTEMKHEFTLGFIGIGMMITGYLIEVVIVLQHGIV